MVATFPLAIATAAALLAGQALIFAGMWSTGYRFTIPFVRLANLAVFAGGILVLAGIPLAVWTVRKAATGIPKVEDTLGRVATLTVFTHFVAAGFMVYTGARWEAILPRIPIILFPTGYVLLAITLLYARQNARTAARGPIAWSLLALLAFPAAVLLMFLGSPRPAVAIFLGLGLALLAGGLLQAARVREKERTPLLATIVALAALAGSGLAWGYLFAPLP